MWQRLKQLGCYLIIIVLLPYVITVFINGPSIVASSNIDGMYVNVNVGESGGGTGESGGGTGESGGDDTKSGKVTQMSMEDYGIGIMAREIPVNYEKETLRAQAVLVRTEIYRKIEQEGSGGTFENSFWTQKQMEEEWGAARYFQYYNKLKNAWRDTEGQVLMYEGKLVRTPFCRLTNGSTRDGGEVLGEETPYLKIKECPEDIEAQDQIQTKTIEDMDAEVIKCDTAGYVLTVRVGKEEVSGEEFRSSYHLASSCFTLQKYNGKLRITTRGAGHGLGMSQNSADRMAKDGKDYKEILEYFFEGTELKEVADIVQ